MEDSFSFSRRTVPSATSPDILRASTKWSMYVLNVWVDLATTLPQSISCTKASKARCACVNVPVKLRFFWRRLPLASLPIGTMSFHLRHLLRGFPFSRG